MTHLEYDEAQNVGFPSLIYLLDESQPVPAKDVETGSGAEKLHSLKEHLKRRHVVSFFTTPEDLQSRILHDVPAQLEQMGAEMTDRLDEIEEASDADILRKFSVLPKLFSGRQITVEFVMGKVRSAFTEDCVALNLESGATVVCPVTLASGQALTAYAERSVALQLLSLSSGSVIRARGTTAYGDRTDVEWTDDGPIPVMRSETGLVIKEILSPT